MVPAEVDSEVVGDANDGDGSEDGRVDWQPGKPGGRYRIPSAGYPGFSLLPDDAR